MLGWMWVVHNPMEGYVLFNYEYNRAAKGAEATVGSFTQGYLQTDGYKSYNGIAARQGVTAWAAWLTCAVSSMRR